MNNQVRAWASEANPSSKEIYASTDWPYNCAAWSGEELSKFAELVKEKCIEAVKNTNIHHVYTTHDLGTHNSAIAAAIESIKEKVNVK